MGLFIIIGAISKLLNMRLAKRTEALKNYKAQQEDPQVNVDTTFIDRAKAS